MTHENHKIGDGATGHTSDEERVAEMLGGLKRIAAPKDFDIRVRARIAQGRPREILRPNFFPILKYAVPLGLFLVFGSVFFIYNSYDPALDQAIVSVPGASDQPGIVNAPDEVPHTAIASRKTAEEPSAGVSEPQDTQGEKRVPEQEPQLAAKVKAADGRSVDFRSSRVTEPRGSFTDRALRPAPTPRTPTGMQLNPLSVSEALKLIGADASFENSSWVIKTVAAGGVAERMGMRSGDRLKAIDGEPVAETTLFPSKFGARTIRVQRSGALLDLSLAGERKP